jgi:iron complex outermembrane receptor protein
MHAELELGDAITIRNIAAYREDKSETPIDFDALPAQDVDVPAIYSNHQFSNELQLLFESERLNGVAGVYYLNAQARNIFDVVLATTGAVIGVPGFTASTFGQVNTRTWAAFADFTYKSPSRSALARAAGFTATTAARRVIRKNMAGGASPAAPAARAVQLGALTSNFTGEETFHEFTPRASLPSSRTTDNTFYASYSKGFKGGRLRSARRFDRGGRTQRQRRRAKRSRSSTISCSSPRRSTATKSATRRSLLRPRLRFASPASTPTIRTCRFRARSARS